SIAGTFSFGIGNDTTSTTGHDRWTCSARFFLSSLTAGHYARMGGRREEDEQEEISSEAPCPSRAGRGSPGTRRVAARGTGFQPVFENPTGKMPVPLRWARVSGHPKGRRPMADRRSPGRADTP